MSKIFGISYFLQEKTRLFGKLDCSKQNQKERINLYVILKLFKKSSIYHL